MFDQRRVLLGHVFHLHDRSIDLFDTGRLFGAGGGDLIHDRGGLLDGGNDFLHGGTRLGDERGTAIDLINRIADKRLDLLCRRGTALRECAHLGGNNRKATPLFSRARRLDCGIECQNVGLERDAVNGRHDGTNLSRALVGGGDACDRLGGHFSAALRRRRSRSREAARTPGVFGILFYRRRELFHARGGFLERRCLLFGACGKIGVAGADLLCGQRNFARIVRHTCYHIVDLRDKRIDGRTQFSQSATHWRQAAREVAIAAAQVLGFNHKQVNAAGDMANQKHRANRQSGEGDKYGNA